LTLGIVCSYYVVKEREEGVEKCSSKEPEGEVKKNPFIISS